MSEASTHGGEGSRWARRECLEKNEHRGRVKRNQMGKVGRTSSCGALNLPDFVKFSQTSSDCIVSLTRVYATLGGRPILLGVHSPTLNAELSAFISFKCQLNEATNA